MRRRMMMPAPAIISGSGISPAIAALYASGEDGVTLFADGTHGALYQETTGASATTPAGDGDPVGTYYCAVTNQYLTAPSNAARPTRNISGGLWRLSFTANHLLKMATPGWSIVSIHALIAAEENNAGTVLAGLAVFAPAPGINDWSETNAVTFSASQSIGQFRVQRDTSSTRAFAVPGVNSALPLAVWEGTLDPESGSGVTVRAFKNGVAGSSSTSALATTAWVGDLLIGARQYSFGIDDYLDGNIYAMTLRTSVGTTGEQDAARAVIASKCGVTL